MRIRRSVIVHACGSYDEFTELLHEYEKIYGHAAEEHKPVADTIIRQFGINTDEDDVILFHTRRSNV